MRRKFQRQNILFTMLLALPIMSSDIYLPSFNAIQYFFHTTQGFVQLTLTVYFLTFGLIQLFYGALSDHLGRRPMILTSLIVYTAASFACAMSHSIGMLMVFRCFQAFGAGCSILIFAIVRDLQKSVNQAGEKIAYMSAVVALSPIVSPIFGSLIQVHLGWQWNFNLAGTIGILLSIWTYTALPETRPKNTQIVKLGAQYIQLLKTRSFFAYTISVASAFAALFAYVSGAPFLFLHHLEVPPKQFGYVFSLAAIGYVIGALINGKIVNRFGLNKMSTYGCFLLLSGSLLMLLASLAFSTSPFSIVVPQIVCEFGIAIIVANGICLAIQPIAYCAGSGAALIGFTRFLFAAIISIVAVWHLSLYYLALIIMCLSIISYTTFLLAIKKSSPISPN